ncbi:MAG: hypothetical protein Q9161_006767 [Pseudevernia consocians]
MSWTQAVQSGEALLRQMTEGGPQSEFRSYADLANSGWSQFPTDGATDTDLDSALRALGATSGTYVNMMQQDDFKLPGSDTEYQYYNPDQGLIIAEFNYSPQRTYKGPGVVYPALNRWSDVVYLVWADLCGNEPDAVKKIKYFIRHHIRIDSPTVGVINEAIGSAGNLNPWPGMRFGTEMEQGKALLGTAHGYGVAWFLINHQETLGRKKVTAVTVFQTVESMTQSFYNLLLEVGDA